MGRMMVPGKVNTKRPTPKANSRDVSNSILNESKTPTVLLEWVALFCSWLLCDICPPPPHWLGLREVRIMVCSVPWQPEHGPILALTPMGKGLVNKVSANTCSPGFWCSDVWILWFCYFMSLLLDELLCVRVPSQECKFWKGNHLFCCFMGIFSVTVLWRTQTQVSLCLFLTESHIKEENKVLCVLPTSFCFTGKLPGSPVGAPGGNVCSPRGLVIHQCLTDL